MILFICLILIVIIIVVFIKRRRKVRIKDHFDNVRNALNYIEIIYDDKQSNNESKEEDSVNVSEQQLEEISPQEENDKENEIDIVNEKTITKEEEIIKQKEVSQCELLERGNK